MLLGHCSGWHGGMGVRLIEGSRYAETSACLHWHNAASKSEGSRRIRKICRPLFAAIFSDPCEDEVESASRLGLGECSTEQCIDGALGLAK